MVDRRAQVAGYLRGRRRLALRWRSSRRPLPTVEQGLTDLAGRFALPAADDEPVFLLSCGWRSGSTLLQRLVTGTGEVLVWGEPYRHADLVGRLAGSLQRTGTFPRDDEIVDPARSHTPDELARRWIANLTPHPAHLVEAHRALFRRLYADPASQLGFSRWGFKEVRLGIVDARYLRLLFPRARIVFLYRDPYEAWDSFRQNHRGAAYRDGQHVWTARQFGRVWRTLVRDVLDRAAEVDGLVVRYEELASGAALPAIERHLDLALDADILDHQVGSSRRSTSLTARVARARLRPAVEPLAGTLGYPCPNSAPARSTPPPSTSPALDAPMTSRTS